MSTSINRRVANRVFRSHRVLIQVFRNGEVAIIRKTDLCRNKKINKKIIILIGHCVLMVEIEEESFVYSFLPYWLPPLHLPGQILYLLLS